MEFEHGPADSKRPALDAFIATCNKEIDGFLSAAGVSGILVEAIMETPMKKVTLADGSATTEVEWSIEDLRAVLIGKAPR